MPADRSSVPYRPGLGTMELGMPVRASVAGMLGALLAIGVACLTPEPIVLREARPVSSPTLAPSPVAAASPRAGPRARVVGARADEVNLRAEPSINGVRLKGLSDGTELELLGREVEVRGRTWRNVRDPADQTEGWVAAEFLNPAR
jgi:Bacterial SH3 domain